MRPSLRFIYLLSTWCALAVLLVAARLFLPLYYATLLSHLWWISGALLSVAALMDGCHRRPLHAITVTRTLPHSMALGANQRVHLHLGNQSLQLQHLTVTDLVPDGMDAEGLPHTLTLPPQGYADLYYVARPLQRGDLVFGATHLRVHSRWGLWHFFKAMGASSAVKVYPNFKAIAQLDTLHINTQIARLGIHLQQKRGDGLEFHQLREFREGDVLRQIDWKTTARYRKPISREYQEERDQDIIFLLDCGRRMRAKDDALSHFDHALNALLLTSHIAVRQGDAVGLLTFAGELRWRAPAKGHAAITGLLEHVYNLHSSTAASDFLQAAEQLMNQHRKRALIILISNIREEDNDDLMVAINLLKKQHLVMLAALRENALMTTLHTEVDEFPQALRYSATVAHLHQRQLLLEKLATRGAIITDSLPQHLHRDLVNTYLNIKRSGKI